MGIRLVSDDESIFWFTHSNWKRMLRFAGQHGWKWNRELLPIRWTDAAGDENFQIVGGARLDADAARLLADAIKRGAASNPKPAFLIQELEKIKDKMPERLSGHDPVEYASKLVETWVEFAAFARKGGFRVDWAD
jgi:hypothetical protein